MGSSTALAQSRERQSGHSHLGRGAKAPLESCGEPSSGAQGADTALRGKSWEQIPRAFQEIVSLISTCVGLLGQIPATDSSLDYGASHFSCLTEVVSVNVCNAKLMLGGSIY